MTIKEVVMQAQSTDIPITYKYTINDKHFSWKNIVDYKLHKTLKYYTEIAGAKAWVNLYFTPSQQILYKIIIQWSTSMLTQRPRWQNVYDDIKTILNQKYGKSNFNFPSDLLEAFNMAFFSGKN